MIMPMAHYRKAGGGFAFEMTAEDAGFYGVIGWAAPGGYGEAALGAPIGSAAGDFAADGGTVKDCFYGAGPIGNTHILGIDGGSQLATGINIDGTDYALSFQSTYSGIDIYHFGPSSSLFVDSVTYQITVT